MHLEASFSILGLPIQKLGMVEGQMGFSPTVEWFWKRLIREQNIKKIVPVSGTLFTLGPVSM